MGEIVEFRAIRRNGEPRERETNERSAQILFFTGVRYTRYAAEADMPVAASRSRRGGRRRWLSGSRDKRTSPS
jgi:hypothetical protein